MADLMALVGGGNDDLYTEIIDWIIGEIGQEMCNKLREGDLKNE